jgi:hypothetical protein
VRILPTKYNRILYIVAVVSDQTIVCDKADDIAED